MDKETLHKELDLIQNVINRMANNSFLIKGWTVSVVAVVIAISRESIISGEASLILLTLFIPFMCFWWLDGVFLQQEKMYRKLYDWVRLNRVNTNEELYNLNAKRFRHEVESQGKLMFTGGLLIFYAPFLLAITTIIAYQFIH